MFTYFVLINKNKHSSIFIFQSLFVAYKKLQHEFCFVVSVSVIYYYEKKHQLLKINHHFNKTSNLKTDADTKHTLDD